MKLEVAVPNGAAPRVVESITHAAGRATGKIFVLDAGLAVRVRTGEEGDDAL